MPEDSSMIELIKNLIRSFNIEVIEVAGYEADDVIGTLCKIAEKKGFTTYMMTPDKDYAQLVSSNSFMYNLPRRCTSTLLGSRGSEPSVDNPLQVMMF